MDLVGTTLGVLGLAGLLSVCLDCFHYIQAGRSLGQDFAFLEGQLSAHGIRLYAWAHACGFTRSDGRYDRRLDSPVWQQHIRTQLNAIALLFLDANKIVRHYGLGGDRHAPGQVTACLIPDSPNARFINDGLCGYLARIRATKTRAGLLGALSWALVHKGELTRLVGQLRQCIEALELVTKNLDLFEAGRRVVEAEIETMTDAESLRNMIAVPGSSDADSDVVSDAASQRLLRIGSAENRVSSISETSVTAQTWPDTDFRAIAETDEPEDTPVVRGAVREAPEERSRPQHRTRPNHGVSHCEGR